MTSEQKISIISTEAINGSITNSLISTFINSSNNFTRQLSTVLLMSSIDEIKKLISALFTYISNNFKDIVAAYNPLLLLRYILSCRRAANVQGSNITLSPGLSLSPTETSSMQSINICFTSQFINGILKYIQEHDDCFITYDKHYDIDIKGRNEMVFKRTIRNFTIEYEGLQISCCDTISVDTDITGNILLCQRTPEDVRSLSDLITDPAILKLLMQYKTTYKDLIYMNNTVYIYSYSDGGTAGLTFRGVNDYSTDYQTFVVCKEMKKIYPNLDTRLLCFEYEVLLSLLCNAGLSTSGYYLNIGNLQVKLTSAVKPGMATFISGASQISSNLRHFHGQHFYSNIQCTSIKVTGLALQIMNYNSDTFKSFLGAMLSSTRTTADTKIKIYEVRMLHEENDIISANPDHVKLTSQLEKLTPDDKDIIHDLKCTLLKTSETITRKCTTHKIESTFITEKSKSFSTLYLRQREKTQLVNLIEAYRSNRDRLVKMGLPDKLGVLLEGIPGTGKTSTIWVIATALNKNIYYVNLDTIQTNSQLTEVFKFVDNETNGGIIVFEDIDSMSNVVLQRTDMSSNSALTLSHMLNLLQGSLTKDGTMFIVTTNHLEHLDKALYRDGRFDLTIKMQLADRYQCAEIFNTFFNRLLSQELLNRLPEDTFTPAKFIFYLAKYMWSDQSDEDLISSFLAII